MKNPFVFNRLNPVLINIIISSGLMGIFSITMAQDNPYTRKADMPTARLGLVTAVVNDSIYAIGGYAGINQPGLTANEVYDPATDTWETRTPIPTGRRFMAASAADDKIYIFGGYTNFGQPGLSTVEEYNPKTDTWTSKTAMPTPRLGPASCVVDGIIYVIGGGSAVSQPLHTVEAYDPQTDTWTQKADMPTARHMLSASVVGGKIYATGGENEVGQSYSKVEEYNPETDTWTEKAEMPTARSGHATSVINGKIYAIGGSFMYDDFSAVEEYDPVTDSWTIKADLPEVRGGPGCSTVNEKIYVIGGNIKGFDQGFPGENKVDEYDPSVDLTTLVNHVSLNKCYVIPGSDSIWIAAKMNDTAGVTLFAIIESSDQEFVDSLQLFDDGNHNDGNAGDSVYSNVWHTKQGEEHIYNVDLIVKWVSSETIIHRMKKMATFTTVGPVTYKNHAFESPPMPGENVKMELTLTNNGLATIAAGIKAKITSLDTLYVVTNDYYYSIGDISPGESKSKSSYKIEISETCPENTEILFVIDITSEGYSFWRDTFKVMIGIPSSLTEEKTLRQPALIKNHPNPFSQSTELRFTIPTSGFVTLRVYDYFGREIRTLVNELLNAGEHSVYFHAGDLTDGIYFYRLLKGDMILTGKMLLMR
jgi:N-acetylneuraminic acid mutarotase